MSKRKKANPWDAVFDRIEVAIGQPEVRYTPRPTEADLDQLESQIGSQLPVDYRALMLRFGPGSLETVELYYIRSRLSRSIPFHHAKSLNVNSVKDPTSRCFLSSFTLEVTLLRTILLGIQHPLRVPIRTNAKFITFSTKTRKMRASWVARSLNS